MSYTNEEHLALHQYLESIEVFTIQPKITKPMDKEVSFSSCFSANNSSFYNI